MTDDPTAGAPAGRHVAGWPAARSVAEVFELPGQVSSMTRVAGPWTHRMYRLTTDRGEYAVKELRDHRADPRWTARQDAAWDLELRALGAGVAMPEPVPNPADRGWLGWVEPLAGAMRAGADRIPVRVHRWLESWRPATGPVDAPTARWAGAALATLHGLAVTTPDRSVYPVPSTDTADHWPELVELAHEAGAPWSPELEQVTPVVAAVADLSRTAGHRPAEEVMSHGDVGPRNLLLTGSGPHLCDWTTAIPVVPRRELAGAAFDLADWRAPEIAREVVGAYRSAGGAEVDLGPADLGQHLMTGVDRLAFNVERALGARSATADEVALGNDLVPALLAQLPRKLAVSRQLSRLLVE